MPDRLTTMLQEREWILTDGATGTNLIAMGLTQGYPPEQWNFEQPDKVRAHYRSFIEAGSDLVLTNTFGGTANRLKLHKAEDKTYEVNKVAAELLCEEIAACSREVVCAGSIGPTGDLFQPNGDLTYEEGVAAFAEQIRGLKDGGVDVVWIETMFDEQELRAALEAAASHEVPAVYTMSFDTSGRTMMGLTPSYCIQLAKSVSPRPIACGGNCGTGAPDLIAGLISAQEQIGPDDVIVAKANCGIPEMTDDGIRYNGTPELMADYVRLARDAGARIIGGCCGTTPGHIAVMREALERHQKGPCPTLEATIETLGPLTGTTRSLIEGGGPPRSKRRRRQG
ncbi:MAG: betaine--homocysteine S-methyltransferase [Methyloligellaceae bacterium]